MISRVNLALRYTAGAVAATLINLATQWISFRLYRGMGELMIGIVAGTAVGLVSKYLMDKFWIFDDRSLGIAENLNSFSYYCLTGVVTTGVSSSRTIARSTATSNDAVDAPRSRCASSRRGLSVA